MLDLGIDRGSSSSSTSSTALRFPRDSVDAPGLRDDPAEALMVNHRSLISLSSHEGPCRSAKTALI